MYATKMPFFSECRPITNKTDNQLMFPMTTRAQAALGNRGDIMRWEEIIYSSVGHDRRSTKVKT